MNQQKHNFNRPWATHRKRLYLLDVIMILIVTIIPWAGVLMGKFDPGRSYYWWGLIVYFFYVSPVFIAWWDAPGENRTTLEKAYEFTCVWIPISAGSQVLWEIPWIVMELMGMMNGAGPQDVWLWFWWGFGVGDTRYLISDPLIFALECGAIPGGLLLSWILYRLVTAGENSAKRLRSLILLALTFCEMLTVVAIYFIAEIYNGFGHLNYDTYGFAYTFYYLFIYMNIWWFIVPAVALPFVLKMIDYLYRVEVYHTANQTVEVPETEFGSPVWQTAPEGAV